MPKKPKGAISMANLATAFENESELVGWFAEDTFILANRDTSVYFRFEPKNGADFTLFREFMEKDRKIIAINGDDFARSMKVRAKLADYPTNVFSVKLMAQVCEETIPKLGSPADIYPLFDSLRMKLIDKDVLYPWEIERKAMVAICEMQDSGIQLDKKAHGILCAKTENDIYNAAEELKGILKPFCKANSFGETEINLDSSKELLDTLKKMKCQVPSQNGLRSINSTNKDEVAQIVGRQDLKEAIANYRELAHIKNNFGEAFVKFAPEGRIYTTFNQIGAPTGRTSTEKPNVSGVPKGVRHIFRGRDGERIITGDYNQCELRILAHMSDDPKFVTAFKNDRDVHSITSEEIFGDKAKHDYAGKYRDAAKTVNFGIVFGITPLGLSTQLRCSYAEASDLIYKHRGRFKRAHEFMEWSGQEALKNGFARTITGRIRSFAGPENQDEGYIRRAGANMVIQGTAADIMKSSLSLMIRFRKTHDTDFCLWNTTYDEVSARVLPQHEEKAIQAIRVAMLQTMQGFLTRVPAKVDVKAADHWSK